MKKGLSGAQGKSNMVRSAMVLRSDDLSGRVVRGAGFAFLGTLFRIIITLGSISILARLLSPADFGYIAMATVVTELAALFSNLGFTSVLIQKRVVTRLQMDTTFWSSALVGVCLSAVVFFLSFLATWLFHEPLTGEILRILCLVFIIEELTTVHGVILYRLMLFKKLFLIQMLSVTGRAAIGIVFAWQGFGVWSLVIGALAGPTVTVILYALIVPYWPRIRFHADYIRSTWRTNSSYLASGFLAYANSNVDLYIIGSSFGATALGFYQNARSLTDEVRNRMAAPLQRVLFPAFSTLQDQGEWLQTSVLRSGRLLAAIVIPVGVGIAAVAEYLIPVLYGEKWLPMIPILKFLGVSTAIRASMAVVIPLFASRNRVGLSLRYNMIGTLILVLMIWVASRWGINAIAAAIMVASLYSLVIYRIGLGLIGLGWKDLWSILGPPAFASGLMWGTIIGFGMIIEKPTGTLGGALMFNVLLGAAVYCAVLAFTSKILISDFRNVLGKLLPSFSR